MKRHQLLQLTGLLFAASTAFAKMEVQLERFEQLAGFHMINATGVRVRKFNRTSWILNGEFDVLRDIGNEYSFTLKAAHSRLGNNQFNEYPLKIPQKKMCDTLNGSYKDYQKYFLDWTNLPRVGEEWLCPFPKGNYWVRNLAPEGGWVPPVVPDGYWRLTAEIWNSGDNVEVRYVVHLHVKKSMTLL